MVNKITTLFLLCTLSLFAKAEVSAFVSQTEVYDNESLILTVRVSPVDDLNTRDIKALESLFTIEQRSRQESRQNINGQQTSSVDYLFRIRPKQSGTLGIPNFRVGSEQSRPIFVNVLKSSQRQTGLADDAVIFTANVETTSPYVDQPFRLTMELAYKIQFRNGVIPETELEDFDTQVLNEGRTTKTINGQTYNVYQREILLTPKKPGLYRFPDIRFDAEYADNQRGRLVRFSRTATVNAIEVRPIPAEFPANAYWLPVKNLTIEDNLQSQNSAVQNNHINWTTKLSIEGLDAKRLPDVMSLAESSLGNSVKLYRNPAKFENNQRIDSAALSFIQPGQSTLPEVRIPWWNTATDSLEWATLPSRQFDVSAEPVSALQTLQSPATEIQPANEALGNSIRETAKPGIWPWLTLIVTIGWITTGLVWWQHTRRKQPAIVSPNQAVFIASDDTSKLYQQYLNLRRHHGLTDSDMSQMLTPIELKAMSDLGQQLFQASDQQTDIKLAQKVVKELAAKIASNANKPGKVSQFALYPHS